VAPLRRRVLWRAVNVVEEGREGGVITTTTTIIITITITIIIIIIIIIRRAAWNRTARRSTHASKRCARSATS
jgi:hypothetical protein